MAQGTEDGRLNDSVECGGLRRSRVCLGLRYRVGRVDNAPFSRVWEGFDGDGCHIEGMNSGREAPERVCCWGRSTA